MITILVADGHAVYRRALCDVLDAEADMHVIGDSADGQSALFLAGASQPNVVVTDIGMVDGDGVHVSRRIAASWPAIRVVGMSLYPDPRSMDETLEPGAFRFVHKHDAADELIDTIRAAMSDAAPAGT